MRIAFSGTANTGKSTMVRDFLTVWPMYSTPTKTYRDVITENNLDINMQVNCLGQQKILDFMVESMKGKTVEDNVVCDRCPIDNVIYSMWAVEKQTGDITEEFVQKCIAVVRESIKDLDIIFWLPFNEQIAIQDDNLRETDFAFIQEINNIFDVVHKQFLYNDKFPLFDPEDRPAMIEISAVGREQRILEVANYIDLQGSSINPDDQWLKSLSSSQEAPEAKTAVEDLITQQKHAALAETGTIVY